MAAYDPKRPRPAQLTDEPAPVEALLDPSPQDDAVAGAESTPPDAATEPETPDPVSPEPATPDADVREEPTPEADVRGPKAPEAEAPEAEGPAAEATAPEPAAERAVAPNVRPAEVPVAPAPEVGTANRAVLYASIAASVVLAAVLAVLRRRSRKGRRSIG